MMEQNGCRTLDYTEFTEFMLMVVAACTHSDNASSLTFHKIADAMTLSVAQRKRQQNYYYYNSYTNSERKREETFRGNCFTICSESSGIVA